GTDEDELSEKEEILFENDIGLLDSESESADTDDEEENIMNKRGGRKRMRLLSSSEEESEKNDQHISIDGTVWEEMQIGAIPGRPTLHNIFREVPGPTGYAKRNIMKGIVLQKFSDLFGLIKKSTRSQRLKTDKFALISGVWNKFIENSQNCYKPGAKVTVDEQLFPTKERCRFTQYMPNKPDKFGIKSWLASEVDSKYIINALPYLGKDEDRPPSVPLGEHVVLKLMEPFTGCGRSVTTDNYFTSISLATKLLAKRTTLVGTIRSNKRELPKIAKKKKGNMKRFSTKVLKLDNCTLTIYESKPKKKVLLLSSKHRSVKIEKTDKSLPETVSYCNQSKFGVDMADQMARKYSTKSKSYR
ncbi:hypothetical protein KPH14_012617, partial [Odynerus spinipes]